MLCRQVALHDNRLTPTRNLSIAGILVLEVVVAYALELLTGLDVERILCEQEPTLQILPAEALEGKLTSTLTTNLVDELLLVAGELGSHMASAYTVAKHVDGGR